MDASVKIELSDKETLLVVEALEYLLRGMKIHVLFLSDERSKALPGTDIVIERVLDDQRECEALLNRFIRTDQGLEETS